MGYRKHELTRLMRRTAIILMLFVTIGTCAVFYAVSRQVLLERTCQADVGNLRQVSAAVENMRQTTMALGQQVYNDNQVAYLLYSGQFDPNKLCVAISQLNNYRITNPYIDSIYIYNKYLDSVTVSSNRFGTYDAPLQGGDPFFDAEAVLLMENGRRYAAMPAPRLVSYNGEEFIYYTSLTSDFLPAGQVQSTVFVNWTSEYLDSVVKSNQSSSGRTMILDKQGVVVSGCGEYAPLRDVSGEDFFRKIQECRGEGYFITDVHGEQTLISYMCLEDFPWQYLRFTPYQVVLGEVDRGIRNLIAISAAIVVLGVAVAYLFARAVRKPVGDIYQQVERLEAEGRNTRQSYRQELLRNLLYGAQSPGYVLRQGVLDNLRLSSERQSCLLVLIRLRGSDTLLPGSGSDHLSLTRYGVGNVAAEICGERFRTQGIDLGGRYLALLLAAPNEGEWQDELTACLEKSSLQLEELLHIRTSWTASDPFPFKDIELAYRTVREADRHQMFCPPGKVLWARQVMAKNARHYVYPSERETQMLEMILALQEEQACAVMHEIIRETEQYAFSVANMVISRLTLALLGVEEDLRSSSLIEDVRPFPTIHLTEEDSIDGVCARLDEMVRQLIRVLENKRNGYHSILVQKITDIIQESYKNPDCCLDSIAGAVGLSTAYTGKLYKRYAMKSVAESIGELRMKEARRLLREDRRLAIAEVAARSGFSSSSYFSKVFRKENGMTPNEYRNLDSKGGSK